MNDTKGIKWRVLIVEDKEDIMRALVEAAPSFVDAPDEVEISCFNDFNEALKRLAIERFDLLILDLKDDADKSLLEDDSPAGLEIFDQLRKTRFVPVVFYTALAHLVRSYETSFVRVVEKTESVTKVRDEVRRVLTSKLPILTRHIEEVQRDYMWNFISEHWKEFPHPADQSDIAYLLARRLAIALETEAGNLAAKVGGTSENSTKAHPMIMYVVPAIGPTPLAGDIVSEANGESEAYWLILTPSCDFAQTKADHVVLAKCERLTDRDEYKKWSQKKDQPSLQKLENIIEDKKGDRYKFLPRAFFIPDLVVDFQQLKSLEFKSVNSLKKVATLDSPFAESVLARFSRYFNRLGTPDLDKAIVMSRLEDGADKFKVEVSAIADAKVAVKP